MPWKPRVHPLAPCTLLLGLLSSPVMGQSLRFEAASPGVAQAYGSSVVGLSDIDDDGLQDFAVGDAGYHEIGLGGPVIVHSGADGGVLRSLSNAELQPGGAVMFRRWGSALTSLPTPPSASPGRRDEHRTVMRA